MIKHFPLGEILIERQIISKEKLEQALNIQRKEKKDLGNILLDLGYVNEQDFVIAMVIEYNFPYIAIEKYPIEERVKNIIPKEIALKHSVVPLDKVGCILSVVMVNPLDEDVIKSIEDLSQCEVTPFISTKSQILKSLNQTYV